MAKPQNLDHTAPCSILQELGQDVVKLEEQLKTLFNGQREMKTQLSAVYQNTQELLLSGQKMIRLEMGHNECKETAKQMREQLQLLKNEVTALKNSRESDRKVSSAFLRFAAGFISIVTVALLIMQTYSMFIKVGG
ncbi:MAG: hypothetical protein HQL72_02325 [Magnetococcales bacterium]|nr:hypothetical protein [Magnetococcales bacterium]